MQLAATTAEGAGAASTAPAIQNVFLSSAVQGEHDFVTYLDTLFVDFAPTDTDPYGGSRTRIRYEFGSSTGIGIRVFSKDAAERVAAQGVLDAVVASGLLQQDLPVNDWKRPAAGRTRLYLDRRQHFLEYETGTAPAVAQPILDALAAYERIAR